MGGPVAFRFRRRRGDTHERLAHVGETIHLDEQVDYVVALERPLTAAELTRLGTLGGELVEPDVVFLSFGNFIGRAEFAGVTIDVLASKIGPGGVSRLLQEISEVATALIFAPRAPTAFGAARDRSHHAPVPYHQLQFLRRVMLAERSGRRLQDWLGVIERNSTRRFEPERPVVSVDRVRRLDPRAIRSVFSRLDRLVPIAAGVAVGDSALAGKLLIGAPPQRHFPRVIAAPRGRLSFDTPENQFVKHVVRECLALVYRFVDHPRLHEEMREDCRRMLGILEEFSTAPFIAEAGRIAGFQAPTQALAKADGYRDIFAFWTDLTAHVSLPPGAAETMRLLEGRDLATLYEYWVFLKTLEAIVSLTGSQPSGPLMIERNELGESIRLDMAAGVGPDVTIWFNRTYRRTNASAYSTPLRPDVTVRIGQALYALDAKYRLDRLETAESDADEEATYKRADLYKMHTYRDAIRGLRAAFVVYPGTEFVFFERSGQRRQEPGTIASVDGVGAIPLRPLDSDPASHLRALLSVLLTEHGHAAGA